MTVGQLLKHDFESKGSLYLYDTDGKEIYFENSNGYWSKREFDSNNNLIYYEYSSGFWYKRDYDSNNNVIYYENSDGEIIDNRPKSSCNGKVIEIEGKRYQLNEIG